jgi:perosamine synthetase
MPFNLQAALGLAQFHRIDELIRIKRDHLKMYRSQLSDLDLEFNIEPDGVINGAWITAMVIGNSYNIDKHKFISKMEKVGIPIRPFFYPLTSIPAFNLEDTHREKNPVSYDISRRGVNLPGAPTLSSDDIKFICDKIREVLK